MRATGGDRRGPRDDLDVAAKDLEVDSIVFDNTDPASLEEARSLSRTTSTRSSMCRPQLGRR